MIIEQPLQNRLLKMKEIFDKLLIMPEKKFDELYKKIITSNRGKKKNEKIN